MNILLAASDRDLLSVYERLLRMDGHTVCAAFDGTQVMKALGKGPYQAAVLEESLPRVEHARLVSLLQEEGVPVVALLHGRLNARHLLRPVLPNAYLCFPFLPSDLRTAVQDAADKLASGYRFEVGGVTVDVSRFCFAGTGVRLTAAEIDMLMWAAEQKTVKGRRARALAVALNQKLKQVGARASVAYTLQKGYGLVERYE